MNDPKDPQVVSHAWQLNSKQKMRTQFYLACFIFILEEMQEKQRIEAKGNRIQLNSNEEKIKL